ncbi:15324_t:CDS:10 [Cetraspora pellucida]|uniref:15324_t:CDS:1 n=1 Tax=Cetraspora pellucida TaxID=1433469 RepID=A0A9N8VIU3_9GLOM|nr:15324_t:CDS:10 [Cetraspora pellucida]
MHKYFDCKCNKWNIVGFLNECDIEPFDKKIDEYLKSLEKIDREEGRRQKKAHQLLDRYRKARSSLSHKTGVRAPVTSSVTCCSKNPRPDYKIAKSWEKELNGMMNGGKLGTINEQENPPLRRTPRKINRGIYAENSNKVNNTSKRTYKEISDEDPEVNDDDDDEIDDEIDEDDNEDDCEDDDENDYEDDDENEDEDVDEDDDENKGEDDNKDKKAKERKKLEKKLIDDFISRFKAINADDKWKLPSGRFVEDVLYDWAVTHRSETLAHSFILDTDCQEVMDLFSPEEKETILNTNKKFFPAVQDDIKKYVMKYYKKNVDDLRETVMEPYLKNGETYNSKLHYDLEWIHLVFNKFVIEWEQGVNALAEDNLEAWIVSHVWTFIVNMALKDIEETKIGKSDGGSFASKMRKNKKRKIGKSIIRGRKIDILLKLRNSSREILAGEVARTGDIHDKKYLGDRIKLLKLMKDMFDTIIESLPPTTIENYESLCTFGIQLFKNKGTVYIMDRPEGMISRLTKKAQLEAPIYIEGIRELILSIITMLELKNAIRGIIQKIESDELEVQVFQRNNTGVRLPLVGTTPTPRTSLVKK